MQSEISCRNPVKYNMFYTAGVWPTYLFVARSIILLQCLSMIHKSGTNLRNEEIWRLLLLEQIPTFVELDDKNTGPNHWKRNKFAWHMLQECAVWNKALGYHTLGAAVFLLDPWTKQSVKYQALLNMNFGKTSSLNKCQLVSLTFKNTEWLS